MFGQAGGCATLGQPARYIGLAPSDGVARQLNRLRKGAGLDAAPARRARQSGARRTSGSRRMRSRGFVVMGSPQGEIERDPLNKPETVAIKKQINPKKSRDARQK